MNQILNFSLRGVIALALVACSGSAVAWPRHHGKEAEAVKVISSISFKGDPVADMSLEQQAGRSYLCVHFAAGETLAIDVTKPDKIRAAEPASAAEDSVRTENNSEISRMASTEVSGHSATEEFALWDISHPGSPRLVKKFSDVYRVIEDKRGYIYVLHRDELSIIRDKENNSSAPDLSIYG